MRILALSGSAILALALAACNANPPEAEAGQDEAVTEPAALAAQAETTSATPDPAITEDDAPLRATPPPPDSDHPGLAA